MPRAEIHDKYDAMIMALAAASDAIRTFYNAEGGAEHFEWETKEALRSVGLARRYAGKPGEVLYCKWHKCLHADDRALLLGEGERWFKGRVHLGCFEAIQRERP